MKVVDSSVPCLSSSLLKSPTVSTNIKSDSVHCDPLSCVASRSRCHTADYLNVTNGVDASIPCLMYSHSKLPPPWVHVFSKSCSNSSLRTQCASVASADAHCATVFHRCLCRARKKRVNRISTFEKWLSPPIRSKCC
jgi:hypothetical protein